jgi:4-hydroxybenzoate polyprenyltransferase
MYLVRYCLILPVFAFTVKVNAFIQMNGLIRLNNLEFFLLVFSTVLIAAAGNIINDYFDQNIDSVNKPDKQFIGTSISEKTALNWYWIFNATALLLSFFLSFTKNLQLLLFTQGTAMCLLWFYSERFKRQLVIGNVIVAALSALVLLMPAIAEPEFYLNFVYAGVYGIFAFIISLIREVVKDMEDVEGDLAGGCRTIPIVYGQRTAKGVAVFLTFILVGFLGWLIYKNFYQNALTTIGNILTIVLLPYALLLLFIARAESKKALHRLSVYLKLLMLFGILSMLPFYYYFLR